MTADVRALLDQLDQAREKATADGEWRVLDIDNRPGPHSREILDDEGSVAVCSGDNDDTGDTVGADRAALIVAAVNALPRLTAALRAVLDECAILDDPLQPLIPRMIANRMRAAVADAIGETG